MNINLANEIKREQKKKQAGRELRLKTMCTYEPNIAGFLLPNPDFFFAPAGQHKKPCPCLFVGGGF
jgi:hypothetical protein